ncbi:hypothetical protein [Kitasatospora putterlickiae]|uniref:hypothetical protein n=1 Tax=Kitasatospora putterlickiae TaxID=221725 RepID=UPI0031D82218
MPSDTQWTPLRHPCGCAVDWGWNKASQSPPVFIDWCSYAFDHPCPWHGGECNAPVFSEAGDILLLEPSPGFTVYARLTADDDTALADTITAQLRHVTEHQARGREAVAVAP